MAQRKRPAKAQTAIDVEALLAELKQRIERDGAVKRSEIVPKSAREQLVSRLVGDGFEAGKTHVRRSLALQLEDALAHSALIPMSGLAAHLRGASVAERKVAVTDAVQRGKARRVLRGKAEVLCGPEVRVFGAEQLRRVGERVQALSKLLEKVTKMGDFVLLADDVEEAFGELRRALPKKAERAEEAETAGSQRPDETFEALLSAVDSTRDARSGLSFVPAIVGRLAPRIPKEQALQLLMTAAAQELLELRPEGGIGRLSEAELSVCPPGPHGTKLSWARRLGGGAE